MFVLFPDSIPNLHSESMFIYRNIATPIGLMEHLQETRFSQKSKGVALTLPFLTNSESQGCPPFSTQESI